jgi:glycosyltransferase involved in cell wall biosynthesis
MAKTILILFPNEWLAYTPTLLNLIDKLKADFKIRVITLDDGKHQNHNLQGDEFEFIPIPDRLAKFLIRFGQAIGQGARLYQFFKMWRVYWRSRGRQADEVIAVDSAGLVVAQKLFPSSHFLSLEPYRDRLFSSCDLTRVKSALAHSPERYDYLFADTKIPAFILPNAPALDNYQPPAYHPPQTINAIFFGNANFRNGVYECLDVFDVLDHANFTLTIKGIVSEEHQERISQQYQHLIDAGRLIIERRYIPQEEVIDYLSQFSIGFCFYNFEHTDAVTQFNFISVPAGKMYNYYAAGVPVIGSDILGLKSVRDFQAGILLEEITPEAIAAAIQTIHADHPTYRDNAIKAARHFDFNQAVEPLKTYLLS